MTELAKRGIIGVAIDARYHGERAGGAKGADAYNAAIVKAWKTKSGEPQEHRRHAPRRPPARDVTP